jgi:hypothetical protein
MPIYRLVTKLPGGRPLIAPPVAVQDFNSLLFTFRWIDSIVRGSSDISHESV